jgi:asparagine synthase (glutamine-hydrolysing)
MVSELARKHVTVALAGDGGDELFAGYDTYEAQALASRFERFLPDSAMAAVARVVSMFPPSEKKKGLLNSLRRFFEGAADRPASLEHYRWMTFLSPAAKGRLYSPALQTELAGADAYLPVREALGTRHDDALNRQLYADLSIYLADDILTKVDRMSMATSLETRAPFLDVGVMELAFSMPSTLKVKDRERKYILKRALRGILPDCILQRRKEGFSIPMKQWLKRDLSGLMEDLISPARVAKRGLFEPSAVTRMMREHCAGRENHAHTLFPLMVFERWAQAFLDSPRLA